MIATGTALNTTSFGVVYSPTTDPAITAVWNDGTADGSFFQNDYTTTPTKSSVHRWSKGEKVSLYYHAIQGTDATTAAVDAVTAFTTDSASVATPVELDGAVALAASGAIACLALAF